MPQERDSGARSSRANREEGVPPFGNPKYLPHVRSQGTIVPGFRCADLGMNCGFEVKNATNKDEVLQIAAVHAKTTHGIQSVPPDLAEKISAAIH